MGKVGTFKWLGVVLVATATVLISAAVTGAAAPTSSVSDFKQCANGAPPSASTACPENWIGSILQANNSHYAEDDVTPQRAVIDLAQGSPLTGRSITLSYQARKGGVHAYDSLATWNFTQTSADRCANLPAADCVSPPSNSAPTSTFAIPSDPAQVADSGGAGTPTSGHQLPGQVMTMYGGTITGVSVPVHDDASGTSDELAHVTVTYSVPSTDNGAKVMLLFGGHIAASLGPRGWGAGLGAGSISGGPYHIKLDALDNGDGNVGSQDNQIMSGAILAPANIVIKKTAVGGDATFNYAATGGISSSFSITTSGGTGTESFLNIAHGTYTVTEGSLPSGWDFSNLACVDPTSNSSVDLGTKTASINLDPGETVTCTFTNSSKATTSVTHIHDSGHTTITSAAIGSTVHDSVSVSGSQGTPTGTVDFTVYLGTQDCNAQNASSTDTATGVALVSGAADSVLPKVVPVGGLSYKAHYNGSSTYNASDAACEPLSASKLDSQSVTHIHDSGHTTITSAAIGSTVHDSVSVSGSQGTPTGTVDFTVYLGTQDCNAQNASSTDTATGVALVSGAADSVLPKVVPVGGLSYKAHYNGSSTYNVSDAACEPLSGTKINPTVATDVHNAAHEVITSAAIGSTVHDKASVSGAVGTPTGTVSFTVYVGNQTCSGEGAAAGTVDLNGSGVADPSNTAVLPAGGLSFKAHYNGDSVYNPGDGPCEPLTALFGTIIVEKQTNPDGAAGSFAFTGDAAGTIGDGGLITVTNLAPGTYSSSEAVTADWTLTSITCNDTNSTGSVPNRTATFNLAAGETVKCTFTNAKNPPAGQGAIDVQKSASPTSLKEPGGPVTFSVTITNTSAVNVTITNVVDDKFGDLDDDGGNGCFDVPINLAPGEHVNCTFQETITGVAGTSHVDTVTVTGHDSAGHQLTASDDAKVDITPRLIDLVIVKEATSPTPLNGIVDYSLTVTNKGPDTATNVQLADPAPAGITYLTANPSQGSCNVSPSLITCSLGNIAAGQTVTIAITARATTVGSHTNTATVTGGGGRETNPADNVDSAVTIVPAPLKPPTVKPTPAPEYCLALTVSPQMIKADGKPDKVTIKVTAGSKPVKGVKVVLSGAGVKKSAKTNGKGLAVLRINPKKPGLITVTAAESNHDLCGPKRIGVVGVFLPPLTG